MKKLRWFALLGVLSAALPSRAGGTLHAIELDPSQPAHATREVCNPVDPLVMWDVVFTTGAVDAGCKSFTATDFVPGVKFMVVKGDHSLTVRYPETHPPIVTGAYDKTVDGQALRCVTVSMPDGLLLQKRARMGGASEAIEEAEPYRVLACNNLPCHWASNGACCCSSPACNCFTCLCTLGCASCTCDSEDGGFWPADSVGLHPYLAGDEWRKRRQNPASFGRVDEQGY